MTVDMALLRKTAREKFTGSCRVCRVCDGRACAGEVPGMGGVGTGASFHNNITALAAWRLNLRCIHAAAAPRTATRILGLDLSLPVIGAAIGGISFNMNGALTEEAYARAVVSGCRLAGTVSMTGDGADPEVFDAGLAALVAEGGLAIPVVKPRENERIVALAKRAADAGAPAFGMDIDAAALVNMTNAGQPVGPKSLADLAFIKAGAAIPFIVKGVMTVQDALACLEVGVDAIVVSNHGGRALDHLPGTAEVLPEIARAVDGRMTVLVDGGVRSGVDVLKMLALGADAVLVGRPLAMGAVGGLAEGVAAILGSFAAQLRAAMVLTGTEDAAEVPDGILRP